MIAIIEPGLDVRVRERDEEKEKRNKGKKVSFFISFFV